MKYAILGWLLLSCFSALAAELDYSTIEEAQYVPMYKMYQHPIREVSIIVTDAGYFPEKIIAYKGEKLLLNVTSTISTPSCLIMSGHDVFLNAEKGQMNTTELKLTNAGEFSYYCPARKYKGSLVVIDRNKFRKRKIASKKKKKKVWMPREK